MLRLSRGEYWLLESVVEFGFSLSLLVDPELDQALNKTAHGLSRDELFETLLRLVHNGWIKLSAYDEPERLNHHDVRTILERELTLPRDPSQYSVGFKLTALGGTTWESFAHPTWKRFVRFDDEEDGYRSYCGVDRKQIESYLRYAEGIEFIRVPGDITWEELSPFDALYWKQMDNGYRVRFPIAVNDEGNNLAFHNEKQFSHEEYERDLDRVCRLSHNRRWYAWG